MAGGKKRKIEIEKRDTKEQRSVTFSKRRKGLFTKAAELCHCSGAQIVILTSSPCANSTSLYSFSSYSSALEIAQCYLNNNPPPKINPNPNSNSNSKFWWENPNLDRRNDLLSILKKTRDEVSACLAKRGEQLGSSSEYQNPNSSEGLLNGVRASEVEADCAVQDEFVYEATENYHLHDLKPLPDFSTSWEMVPNHDSSLYHSPSLPAAETRFLSLESILAETIDFV